MEDSLNYMNAVSQASQALNQVTALRQEAEMQFQQKKEQFGQALELPSEISFTTGAGYLGKKVLGYVSEKFGSTITDVASKAGISEETVGKALSGDITGALEQGAQEVSQTVAGAVESAVGQAQGMVGGVVEGAIEEGTGILGKISSGLENIPSINIPSISTEDSIGNMFNQGLEDLRAQSGIDEASFREYTNVSLDDLKSFSYNSPPAPAEVEMTDFSTIGTPSTTAEAGVEAAETGGEVAAETTGEVAAEVTGEVAGAEAVGAGLDATGILAPLGALVGVIGGIVGFFEGRKEESETMPVVATPILNPASQFL